jgi:hypothetical protein
MNGAIPPLLQYAFMAWCLVKHRDNFTFTLSLPLPFYNCKYDIDKGREMSVLNQVPYYEDVLESGGIAPHIFNFRATRRLMVSFMPRSLYPLDGRLSGLQSRTGGGKSKGFLSCPCCESNETGPASGLVTLLGHNVF